jgi:hypothetical protein
MVETKWRPNHLKAGPDIFLTSLDRFIIKKSHKKIFYSCQNGLVFCHLKVGQKSPAFKWLKQDGCQFG